MRAYFMKNCGMNLKSNRGFVSLILATLLIGGIAVARADVKLPTLFTDNMVLQQGMKVTVWGWADEGETVTVTFRGQKVTTTAHNGAWMVTLKKLKAGG